MQFDDFDKKVREAAEHHHPAYEERAWDQMEKLLDKHLPVEKKRRRGFLFFLLPILLLGGGIYFWTLQPQSKSITNNNKQNSTTPTENLSEKDAPVKKSSSTDARGTDPVKNEKNKITVNPVPEAKALEEQQAKNKEDAIAAFAPVEKKLKETPGKTKIASHDNFASLPVRSAAKNKIKPVRQDGTDAGNPAINSNNTVTDRPVVVAEADPATVSSSPVPDKTIAPDTAASTVQNVSGLRPDTAAASQEKPVTEPEKSANKPAKKKGSSFAFTFTMGPDVSAVGLSKMGKLNSIHGAGLSYTYKRFTLRSGFYMVKKVYTADPDDYNPPEHYWTRYVDLTKVEADCKVYEIPVTLSYNFGEAKKHSWFAAAGLSSYLMKSEKYHYYYKDQTGNPRDREWSTKNNNSTFSVLNLSAGYEIKINKNLSFITEPYFKIPLEGIGFGNIQLNSMGMLFTLTVKPFAPRK